ncbi:2-succinyl-6-hydroxy-2, 4-cyclohexadiene-1-carboxylate synthase [Bradyrhizobium ivorense]|uniref:2-succinyl-6-hydroxy-2, 4-cyclohexadiene-1-carboxylate synthase n=2 Tax=Bradyrhizobium ivorense TaxID=2511166 RepID=A0A508SY68_9BRAD|nr:2-succinyl-6-hydroxy-2, 4-cyclohexadiene-1-carboxylate synthase [Bradyrhizobium ivorense]
MWRGVIALLGDRFRAVTTSLLGYGDTEERRTPDDVLIEREIDVIEAVIQRTNSTVHLVGHSYGGTVCLATALRDRTKIASMTLIEATPFNLLRHSGDLGLYQQVRSMSDAYVRSYHSGKQLAARSIIDFYGGDGSFDTFSARIRDYIVATTPTNILDWSSEECFDLRLAAYAGITAPSLLVRGQHSPPPIQRVAEVLSGAIPGSSLVTVPGASHFMVETHPADVARLIREHVATVETLR